MKFLSPIDLVQNEIRNGVLQVLASMPGSPKQGQICYDSVLDSGVIYSTTAGAWIPTNPAKALTGSIPNTALATNPLARANHTGTQVAATISDFDSQVHTSRLDQLVAPTGDVSMGGRKLTSLANGVSNTDAVTVQQLQGAIAGIDAHPSCRLASTANLGLSGLSAIDGVTPIAGDRILVKNQTTATQNGVYVAAAGGWSRDSDVITAQSFWFVEEGSANGSTQWKVSTTGAIVIGTTNVTIVQWGGGGSSYSAGDGLGLTGTVFAVKPGAGIIADGTSTRADLAVLVAKYAQNIGNGSLTTITVTHNLGTLDVLVSLQDASGNAVATDWQATGINTIALSFTTAPTTNQYRVTVHA